MSDPKIVALAVAPSGGISIGERVASLFGVDNDGRAWAFVLDWEAPGKTVARWLPLPPLPGPQEAA